MQILGIAVTLLAVVAFAVPTLAGDAPPKKLKLRDTAPAAESSAPVPAAPVTATGKSYKDPYTGMEFVFVKGGCYQMGDTFGDGTKYELPVHEVCVSDFWMGKYEVTQGEWVKVMGRTPRTF
jgi:formylglycine-generating enzyme required for sulfatase activity